MGDVIGETVVGDIIVVADYKSCKRLIKNEDIGGEMKPCDWLREHRLLSPHLYAAVVL